MELFPSTLIISSNKNDLILKIEEICSSLKCDFGLNNPDLIVIDNNSGWSIETIRSLKKFISQEPFNHQSKIIVIFEADKLNQEAQNALLKTLEEPGDNNYIILATSKPSSLLSTIISRCHTLKISSQTKTNPQKIISPINNISKDLLISENLSKNKDEVLSLLESQLEIYQKLLLKNPSLETQRNIEKLIKSIRMIQANVDPKSALDYFFLA